MLITFPVILRPSISTELPDETNVKGAFEGAAIVAPIIDKSPIDTLAKDNVPDPFVFKNCPASPSDVGYDKPDAVNAPEVIKVQSTINPSFILIAELSDESNVVPFILN